MDITMFIWLSLALAFLVLEIANPGLFFFLSFSCGALLAAGLSWLGYSPSIQLFGALLGTCIACIVLFYWVRNHYGQFKKSVDHQSNVYALVGRKGWVTKTIEAGEFGFVKLGGETWMARSLHGTRIEQGQEVEVLYIQGAHVVVEKINHINAKG